VVADRGLQTISAHSGGSKAFFGKTQLYYTAVVEVLQVARRNFYGNYKQK